MKNDPHWWHGTERQIFDAWLSCDWNDGSEKPAEHISVHDARCVRVDGTPTRRATLSVIVVHVDSRDEYWRSKYKVCVVAFAGEGGRRFKYLKAKTLFQSRAPTRVEQDLLMRKVWIEALDLA